MGSTGPVFAHYCSARLAVGCAKARTASVRTRTASEGHLTKLTRRVHVRFHAILGQKSQEHTENRENACDSCIAGGLISHGPQTHMAPQVLRPGEHPWVSCMRHKH